MNYLLLAIGYLLFAALAWRRLPWAVLFVIATLPSYLIRFSIGPVPMTLLEGMILIIVLAWVIKKFLIRTTHNPSSPPLTLRGGWVGLRFCILHSAFFIPITLLLLAATISLFVAPDWRAAAGIWKAYFIEPMLFFLVLRGLLHNPPQPSLTLREGNQGAPPLKVRGGRGSYEFRLSEKQIIIALSLTALLLSLYAIYQRFTGFGIPPPWDKELRVTSIFLYPNALALFLAPLVPLFVAQSLTCVLRRGQKLSFYRVITSGYWLLATVLSLIAIVFAQSTGAVVGIVVGLFFMCLIWSVRGKPHDPASPTDANAIRHCGTRPSAGRRELFHARVFSVLRSRCYVLITVAVLAVLAVLAPFSFRNELLLRDWSGHVRRTQWAETIELLKDRPLLGAGLAGYKDTLAPYHKAKYLEIFEYPHNIILNFWSEIGLLGIISFVGLIVTFYRKVYCTIKNNATSYSLLAISAVASMTTLLVHGLVDVPYFKNDLAILFWIVYAIGVTNNESAYATSHKTLQTH